MSKQRSSSKIFVEVVAAVIAAWVIYLCRSWIPVLWKWLGNLFAGAWRFLWSSHPINGCLLVLFVACSLVVFLQLLRAFLSRKPSAPPGSNEYEYRKDSFFGVTWRWEYGQHGVFNVVPFCPMCDMQIRPSLDYVGSFEHRTGYNCDNCGHQTSVDGQHEYIEDQVTRQIHRKLRSGEWKRVVEKQRDR